MKKIPTVFVRNPDDRRHVLDEVNPGCEWVFAGEGVATRKFDGTCVEFDGQAWWARREVKPGKAAPDDFRPEMTDETTGKTVGWVPMESSAFARWHEEAVSELPEVPVGTYELCGPKVNGNPEGYERHTLVRHDVAERLDASDLSFDGLARVMAALGDRGIEGLVWHHPDGRMAKLKVRDFPRS